MIKTESKDLDQLDKEFLHSVKTKLNLIQQAKRPEISHFTDKITALDKSVLKIEKKNK